MTPPLAPLLGGTAAAVYTCSRCGFERSDLYEAAYELMDRHEKECQMFYEEAWAILDAQVEAIYAAAQAAATSADGAEYLALEVAKAEARGGAQIIALFDKLPVDAISAEAGRRYETKQAGGDMRIRSRVEICNDFVPKEA